MRLASAASSGVGGSVTRALPHPWGERKLGTYDPLVALCVKPDSRKHAFPADSAPAPHRCGFIGDHRAACYQQCNSAGNRRTLSIPGDQKNRPRGPEKRPRDLIRKLRRRPTLPLSLPSSTIGPGGLNFRVRDGIGCGPSGIAAGNRSFDAIVSCSSAARTSREVSLLLLLATLTSTPQTNGVGASKKRNNDGQASRPISTG